MEPSMRRAGDATCAVINLHIINAAYVPLLSHLETGTGTRIGTKYPALSRLSLDPESPTLYAKAGPHCLGAQCAMKWFHVPA